LAHDAGADQGKRLDLAFRFACGRLPLKDELETCEKFLAKQRELYAKDSDPDTRVWTDLCQMLFASNAFLYVD
jgi:hypothetical protein